MHLTTQLYGTDAISFQKEFNLIAYVTADYAFQFEQKPRQFVCERHWHAIIGHY